MSKHSPSPWTVQAQKKGSPSVYAADGYSVVGTGNARTRTFEQSTADAQLIAAAPELLQALKILNHHAKIEDVDRLIAKAEGNES